VSAAVAAAIRSPVAFPAVYSGTGEGYFIPSPVAAAAADLYVSW